MTFFRRTMAGAAALLILGAVGVSTAAPAQAATAQWYSGSACHNVTRTEAGGTLALARTGHEVQGMQGNYTLTYLGVSSTSANTRAAAISSPGLTYGPGSFSISIYGAVAGECASGAVARATGVPTGGMGVGPASVMAPAPTYVTADDATVATLSVYAPTEVATERTTILESVVTPDETLVTVEFGDVTITTLQSIEVVEAGEVQISITDRDGQEYTITNDAPASYTMELAE